MKPSKYSLEDILFFIQEYKRKHNGCSPTYRAIMNAVNIPSTSMAKYLLDKMVDQKMIWFDEDHNLRIDEPVPGL